MLILYKTGRKSAFIVRNTLNRVGIVQALTSRGQKDMDKIRLSLKLSSPGSC